MLACAPLQKEDLVAPRHGEMDVLEETTLRSWFLRVRPELVIHCAAVIRSKSGDAPKQKAHMSRVNVMGAARVARAARDVGARLVYISTDFVFDGAKPGGLYREDDAPAPLGYYALTKLGGEAAVHGHPDLLVVRTSFNDDGDWPYPAAFVDCFTSKLPASRAAHEIALAAKTSLVGPLHVGGERQSYFDFARRLRSDVRPLRMTEVSGPDPLPVDTSLDTSRWRGERERLSLE